MRFELFSIGEPVRTDPEKRPVFQPPFHQFDFVAAASVAFVATAQDADALAFREETLGEPDDHGRLTGSAYGEITNADDGPVEALLVKSPPGVEGSSHPNDLTVHSRERPEQQPQYRRQIHCLAPSKAWET